MSVHTVTVNVREGYQVSIGPGLLPCCGEQLKQVPGHCQMAVITDSNVKKLYLDTVMQSLHQAGFEPCSYAFEAGETSKDLNTFGNILEFLAKNRLTRADCVAALGGGVVGDLSGFAAACFMRGIRFVQIPTTLLAAVDSSVGGKTAINLSSGKNLAGAYLQPAAVICDTDCLNTLTDDVFTDGLAEAIKTGVLAGEDLFSMFESSHIKTHLTEIIAKCVSFKASIVEADERENGVRKILNLGHTVGHAIEKCSHYSISHGHAVSIGLAIIARASLKLGWSDQNCSERIVNVLMKNRLPVSTRYAPAELAAAAISDKKRTGNSISVIIPHAIGKCVIREIPIADLENILCLGTENIV